MKESLRDYGPGKFDLIIDQYTYQVTLEFVDEDVGDVQTFGWYGLLRGELLDDIEKAAKEDNETLTDEERDFLSTVVGAIVSEDSQGFVSVEYFDNARELEARWKEIKDAAEKFYAGSEPVESKKKAGMSDALCRIDALIASLKEQETPPTDIKKEPEKKDEPEKKEAKITHKAQEFISKKISTLRREGYPQKQAIAIAYQMARDAGYDVPDTPKREDVSKDEPEKKDEPKKEPEREPEKKDTEAEMKEGCGFTRRQLEMAKVEMLSYDNFLDKYQENDETAFKSSVVEDDDPLMARMREVPPQQWFERCVRIIGEDTSVDDPAALCAWMWWNHMTSEQRKRVKESQR